MKINFKIQPSEKWLEELAMQLGTIPETATTFTVRYEDSFLRVNTVPYNKNFIPFVGKLVTQQPLGFCKENFGTNEYWTLQLVKSSRKHKLELINESGEVRVIESRTSGVFFSSSMIVDLELEASQETSVLSVNLHRDWLCEQLGISESVEPDESKLRELLMSESASFLCISTYPDWIEDLVDNVGAFNWKLMLQAKCLQLIADLSSQLRGKKSVACQLNGQDLQKIESIEAQFFGANKVLPSIDFLAKEAGMSISKFKKCFKIRFGASPYEYYLNLKLDEAKNQLLEKKWTISEIASQLGYTSTANFDKAFKKRFLVNPSTMLRNAS
ncbi:AraC family transcriptional regulator [Runella sp. SP2]|uniref:helix-turn-helix domain-containing protein n=1 Tax=Runella sp. SP2 TaxID=2268026 RepID=UPI000F09366B|nr:AraC family transcriptional regulator [Runella sp. SP2]AYQ33454.1 AraC family transcriptional regulator [Runella sp. SP2]